LPDSLDETYEQILREIRKPNDPIIPSYLTLPPVSGHNKLVIHPTVSSTSNAAHQISSSSVLASTLSAQEKGTAKVVKSAPGYLDMSKFIVKTPFNEWSNKDIEASQKWWLVLEDQHVAIQETKWDSDKRALVTKRVVQNERQKKRQAKMVQKEIAKGIRDDDGKVKKKQKVSETSI